MPRLRLNDGHKIPALGFGIWQVPAETTAEVVASAIATGYQLIDGAAIYGNETGLGAGIRRSGLSRDQVFVTSKIWNTDHGHDQTLRAFDASVARLGLVPDLMLIHWPCPEKGQFLDTWRALIRLREEGRLRSIGVSNFMADHLERLIGESGVTPVVNQIELHPGLQQDELRALHDRLGIVTQSWTPLGQNQHFDSAPIRDAMARSGKTAAQVVLRWHLQLGCAVIPRSTNPARQAENLALDDFSLTEDEMAAIATLDTGTRLGPDPMRFG